MNLTPLAEDFRRIVNMGVFSGVNQFQTYLFWHLYDPAVYRGMNEYLGRLSLALRGARNAATVGLYYPIETFQANFTPSPHFWARKDLRTPVWQDLFDRQDALDATAENLCKAGIDFNWLHGDWIRDAVIENGGLVVGSHRYSTIVLPEVELMPQAVADKLNQFRQAGGQVVLVNRRPVLGDSAAEHAVVESIFAASPTVAAAEVAGQLGAVVPPDFELRVQPPAQTGPEQEFFTARFTRDGRRITYLVNNSLAPVRPSLSLAGNATRRVAVYNPLDGSITARQLPGTLTIAPSSSLLVVENPATVPAEEFPMDPVLSVVNGNFADRTGLTNTFSGPTIQWSGGFPAGWSGGTSAAYAVVNLNGVAYANLGELAPGGQPNAITQLVGTNHVTSDIRLSFALTNFNSSSSIVGVAFYGPDGVALGGTNVSGAGAYSHTLKGVAPGTAIRIALWGTSSSAPMGVTDVGVECYATTSTLRWNGGLAGTWTDNGGGWIETADGSAANWNRPTPPTALFSNTEAAAVTVAGNGVAVGGMQVAGGDWTFSGGSITNTGTWSVAAGASADIRAGIAGSAGLTKQGGGRMILAGTNTYSGATVVEDGTLALTGSLGSTASLLVAQGAVLETDPSSPSSVAGNVVFSPGARLKVARTPSAPAVRLLSAGGTISGAPVLEEAVPGYTLRTSVNVVWLRANALSVANGGFADFSGLAVNGVTGQWRDGLPLGWTSEMSTNAVTPTFSVFVGNGTTSVANLSQLGLSGAGGFRPLYQTVGTTETDGTFRVSFEISNNWTPGSVVGVGAAIYQVETGAVGAWPMLASSTYNSAGSRSLEANVAAGTPLAIAFWQFGAANAGLDNVALSFTTNPPSGLSYAPDSMDVIAGTAATPLGPPAVNGTVSNYSVSPPLPPGLSINPSTGLISGTPSAVHPRTSHTVTASNGEGSTTTAVTIIVRSVFDGWAAGYGLDPATDGADTADPDGDSRTNAEEFAFGTDPLASGASSTIVSSHGEEVVIEWLARTDGAVAYTVEEREDLAVGSWQPSSVAVQSGGGPLPPPPGYEWRRASVAVTERKFLRIVASF
jgi:autotransporter-associated beta strand protein